MWKYFFSAVLVSIWSCSAYAYEPGQLVNCTAIGEEILSCDGVKFSILEEARDTGGRLILDMLVVLGLVIVAGIMSGLTLGLLSLDTMNLEIIINAGEPEDAKKAKKILPLVKKHHLLLVTLLLANAAAMEALPIFLDKMVPTWAAIVLSVTLVLLFGEIIPQALCSRFGLSIGASLSYLVWFCMGMLFIIAWPLSKILDALLGAHQEAYFKKRGELKELLKLHGHENLEHGILTVDETTILKGALEMKDKIAQDVMTPLDKIFMLEVDQKLDQNIVQQIADSGRSRIPVYREARDHIIGVLLVKSLLPRLLSENATDTTIDDLQLRKLPTVSANMSLYDLLNQFQTGKSHMAVVVSPIDHMTVLGIVTLEDVIEELIQEEIYDEADLTVQQKLQLARKTSIIASPPAGRTDGYGSTSTTMTNTSNTDRAIVTNTSSTDRANATIQGEPLLKNSPTRPRPPS